MNEQQWLTSGDASKILHHLTIGRRTASTKVGRRRLKLFCLSGLRLIWDFVEEPRRPLVELIEREIDGTCAVGDAQRLAAYVKVTEESAESYSVTGLTRGAIDVMLGNESSAVVAKRLLYHVCLARGVFASRQIFTVAGRADASAARVAASAEMAERLREIFGNPFRLTQERRWSADLQGLAQACYDDHSHYPLLADALTDLGEDAAAEHCRRTWHVKGCHVVDRILGKA